MLYGERAPGVAEVRCIAVDAGAPAVRIPGWCAEPLVNLNSEQIPVLPDTAGLVTLERRWSDGDAIEMHLPMCIRTVDRDRGALALRLGPLGLALGVPEIWRPVPDARGLGEWEVTPRASWNFGLWPAGLESWRTDRSPSGERPFGAESVPVVGIGHGARIPGWQLERNSAAQPPESPVASSQPIEEIRLVPYGSARLRVTEFPVVEPQGTTTTGHAVYD